ncbi:MAG: response regulator [Acidobacteriota bacterium]
MLPPDYRILYVDDDADSLEVMQLWLTHDDERYSVTAVSCAKEALTAIDKETFDLFILDFRMPDLDGADLCFKIKKVFPRTPVLIYSANARETDRSIGFQAGADEFLTKPNDFDKFAPTVRRLLSHTQT